VLGSSIGSAGGPWLRSVCRPSRLRQARVRRFARKTRPFVRFEAAGERGYPRRSDAIR
jgi:hypothetical protein